LLTIIQTIMQYDIYQPNITVSTNNLYSNELYCVYHGFIINWDDYT